jgi:hypothetical protein
MRRGRRAAPRQWQWIFVRCGLGLATFILPRPCFAGPPYITDDPIPVESGHWEINSYSASVFAKGAAYALSPAVDANYGALPNLQVHVIAPLALSATGGMNAKFGLGDVEFGMKYRFLTAESGDWWPQIGIYPLLDAPSGDAGRGLGTGRTHTFLPVWIQKNFEKWTTYGGGGYWINPGPGNRNYWFVGWVLQRQVTESLALGGEIFHQTRLATGGSLSPGFPLGSKDSTGFNLGAIYDFNQNYHLLFSAGRGLRNASATNAFSYYLALQWTF